MTVDNPRGREGGAKQGLRAAITPSPIPRVFELIAHRVRRQRGRRQRGQRFLPHSPLPGDAADDGDDVFAATLDEAVYSAMVVAVTLVGP